MVANILIAIGFFFTGLISGMWCTVKAYQKALDEWKKSGYLCTTVSGNHLAVYEL